VPQSWVARCATELGCQIILGATCQNWKKYTKLPTKCTKWP
jgi:hypothetical protein